MSEQNVSKQMERTIRLGMTIRALRETQKLSTEYMARKLGYAKIERGEIKDLCIWKVWDVCRVLNVSPFRVLVLADIGLFEQQVIQSWEELFDRLKVMDEKHIARVKKMIQHLKVPLSLGGGG